MFSQCCFIYENITFDEYFDIFLGQSYLFQSLVVSFTGQFQGSPNPAEIFSKSTST